MPCISSAAVAYASEPLRARVFPVHKKRTLLPRPRPGDPRLPLAVWQDPSKGGIHQGVCWPAQVELWWKQTPDADIGYSIPPGRLVIDIDDEQQIEQLSSELRRELASLRAMSAVVKTKHGWHVYAAVPLSFVVRRHVIPGIDIRVGGRHLVVLPPSSGYEWHRGGLARVEPLPPAWCEFLAEQPERRVAPRVQREPRTVSFAPSTFCKGGASRELPPKGEKFTGQRHTRQFPYACALRTLGEPEDEALALVLDYNRECWTDPKDERLVEAMVRDAYTRYDGPDD